jgi:alpha-2-macroglobulin
VFGCRKKNERFSGESRIPLMDTPAPLVLLKNKLSRFGAFCRQVPAWLLGNFSWRPPLWLSAVRQRGQRIQSKYPRILGFILIGTFLVCCAAAWTWNWYDHLPKPRKVTVTIQPIPVTRLEKQLRYPPLVVYFSEPAARLEDLHKTMVQGIRLEPKIAGTWHWAAGDVLLFQPTEDWPAAQKFQVQFNRDFFPRHVLLERLNYEAQSPAFTAAVRNLELYQDPSNPKQRQVTATMEFSHAVEPGELERHLQLSMVGGSPVFSPNDPPPHFAITYGLHRRLAFLRSSFVALPVHDDFMKLTLTGMRAANGAATQQQIESKLSISSLASMFRIDSIKPTIARNKTGEPEQVLVIATTADISTSELAKAMEVRLLPKRPVPDAGKSVEGDQSGEETTDNDDGERVADDEDPANDAPGETQLKENELWQSANAVPDDIIEHAQPVSYTALPSEKPQDRAHAVRIRVENDGELFVRIRKGVRAFGDYPLTDDYTAVVRVPALPREVQIEGRGGLLALNGEKKLSIRSRGLSAIEYEVARVATTQINHLVSQTEGKFQHPQFSNPEFFNQENISRIAMERQGIASENKWTANYSAFDFSAHLARPSDGGSERGLFFLTARGWDPTRKKPINKIKDSRFVLVTDIGILTKRNADNTTDVFVMSIKEGKPLAGVVVDLLGKNGIALVSAKSDGDGRCSFGKADKMSRDRTPIAFVARNGDDVSFIPYQRQDRQINFSRFDIEGEENVLPENLDAFVFTERGIYRPGDEIHVGVMVKQRNWAGQLKGLPVEVEVLDARGHSVQTKKLNLPEAAFGEFGYVTAADSPTGLYSFNVYLTKNAKRTTLLGSTTANVKEFLPDRLRIQSRLSQQAPRGWIRPEAIKAAITLGNLYGTPATDRRVVGRLELMPTCFGFPELRDYTFFDPLAEANRERRGQTIELGEQKTDDAGQTQFDLQLERFADATYSMRFIAEGFEAEGGRSVTTTAEALVSALPYVVGCKPDGDLRYIDANKARALDLVAVDSHLKRIAIENVTVNVVAQEYVSVLTKQENGNYAYQSVLKERLVKSEKISVSANGSHYQLPVDQPGNYIFELRDDQDRRVTKIQFSVVGRGNLASSRERNSELQVKLDRSQYNSGEEIAISITAPYAGSGLITIERDRVYAQRWFQTGSSTSVQRIQVPADFEGSGYVNVAFVRALDSKEVFVSPLSYGVVPFIANQEKRKLNVQLDLPRKIRPGEALRIGYRTERPSRIVVFAVDQGILQVTDFKTPDPLGYLFRKCALRVETAQIVDMLIPEFSLLRAVSAYGGGGDVQRLNPFKRVTEKPVVFWSGIIDAGPEKKEVVYDVPDYFDGTLKIMAVAVADDAVGSAEAETLVRGPFVITPSVPVLVAPGDEFEAGLTVANNVEGSGANAEIAISVTTNEKLSLLGQVVAKPAGSGAPTQTLVVAEGREQSTVFRFRANDKLGSGEIIFTARANGQDTRRRATLSVRPGVPYVTDVRSGNFKGTSTEISIIRQTHGEFRKLDATVSAVPIGLARGLDIYLKNFPYGCSEQITSGALCRLMLADETDFGLSRAEINKQLEYTFGVVRRRQNDQGAFGYWIPEPGDRISFVSAYVMDFLIEAKIAGFAPPSETFSLGLRNLQQMVTREPHCLGDARTIGYAIYLLSREGVITTNYILNLQDYLEKNFHGKWQNDLTGVYLAGALHLLHKDAEAEGLIGCYKLERSDLSSTDDFYQPLGADSQYVAVLAREFPARLRRISGDQFEQILGSIGAGNFNTLSAAYAVRALKACSQAIAANAPQLTITERRRDKTEVRLVSNSKLLVRSQLTGAASAVRFNVAGRTAGPGAFFQVVEAGFDRQLPTNAISDGLEIYRELLGKNNVPATETRLGEPVRVRLHVRSLKHRTISNVAVIDLIPGGFEVVDSTARTGACSKSGIDYVDVREDRVVFFAEVPVQGIDIDYTIKSCNRGTFVVPPVFAESMYDHKIRACGMGGRILVTE